MQIDYVCIGARIKKSRKQKHITQEQLAESLSVTVGYVSQLERGVTKINLETLSSIASILDQSISYYIEGASSVQKEYLYSELDETIIKMTPEQRKLLLSLANEILMFEVK